MAKQTFDGKGDGGNLVTFPAQRWTPEQWIFDDCKVKECIDGYIHYDYAGYETVSRCPRCTRARNNDGQLNTGIPVYQGTITLRTDDEMADRKQERQEIVDNRKYRYRVVAEKDTTNIGRPL